MSVFKKVLSLTFAVLLLAGCGGGGGSDDSSGDNEPALTKVQGSFVIPAAGFPGSSSAREISGLTGNVIVTIGGSHVLIPASNITLNAGNDYLVHFSENVNVDGITVITCTSALFAGTAPIEYAGYNMTAITAGEDNDINGTNSSAPLTEADFSGFTATDVPSFDAFTITEPAEDALVTTFSASVSQLECSLVYIRVNNAYRPLDVYASSSGDSEITGSISLVPGQNTVQLFAINSKGFTASGVKEVFCTADNVAGAENFLFTLTWDNLSDIDLHTFYYATTPAAGTATPTWHNYYGNKNEPEDDSIINNLDVDNTYGYGPEHFTLLGAPDGYYIVALNAYRMDSSVEQVNAFVTVQATGSSGAYGPFTFEESDGMDNMGSMNTAYAWYRIADIKVTNGVATIISPNTEIVPCSGSYYSMISAASIKR